MLDAMWKGALTQCTDYLGLFVSPLVENPKPYTLHCAKLGHPFETPDSPIMCHPDNPLWKVVDLSLFVGNFLLKGDEEPVTESGYHSAISQYMVYLMASLRPTAYEALKQDCEPSLPKRSLLKQRSRKIDWCDGCKACKYVEELKRCGKCKGQRYCSVECQKKMWANHKLLCG